MNTMKTRLSWACCFLGLGCLLISLFFPTTPQELFSDGEVRYWESPARTHVFLALKPLITTIELISILVDPEEYGGGDHPYQGGDGYASLLKEKLKAFFCSIPVSISWFMVWAAPFLRRRMSPFTLKALRASGFSMLVAAGVLADDYYFLATLREGYFHLGLGAYLIVGSFLMSGVSLLTIPVDEAKVLAGVMLPSRMHENANKNPFIAFALGFVIPGAGLCYLGKWIWGIATSANPGRASFATPSLPESIP